MTNDDAVSGSRPDRGWPWQAKLIVVLSGLLVAIMLVVLPILIGTQLAQRSEVTTSMDIWGPYLSTLLGLTSMTVAGIFVFMTFRIDRGVKNEVHETVRDYVGVAMREVIAKEISNTSKVVSKSIDDAKRHYDEEVKSVQTKLDKETKQLKTQIDALATSANTGFSELGAALRERLSDIEKTAGDSFEKLRKDLRDRVIEAKPKEAIDDAADEDTEG